MTRTEDLRSGPTQLEATTGGGRFLSVPLSVLRSKSATRSVTAEVGDVRLGTTFQTRHLWDRKQLLQAPFRGPLS